MLFQICLIIVIPFFIIWGIVKIHQRFGLPGIEWLFSKMEKYQDPRQKFKPLLLHGIITGIILAFLITASIASIPS